MCVSVCVFRCVWHLSEFVQLLLCPKENRLWHVCVCVLERCVLPAYVYVECVIALKCFFCLSHRFAAMTTAFIMTSLPLMESYCAGWCKKYAVHSGVCMRKTGTANKMQRCMITYMRVNISQQAFE